MRRIHAQSIRVSLGLVAALAFPATAFASAPINVGTGNTTPAVAVDAAGTAYIAWEDSSGPFLHYCKLPAGAVACTVRYSAAGQTGGLTAPQQPNGAGLLGSPSVILEGSDVLVFAYDNGGGSDEGVAGWVSTDGGNTFTNEPPGTTMSYTPPNNDSVTTNPVTALGNGLVAVGYVVPLGSPQVQAVQYDPATMTFQAISQASYIPPSLQPPFATLDPSNTYAAGNLGGEFAAQPFGSPHAGLMGAITTFPQNDAQNACHDGDPFTAWSFAPLSAGTTQAALNTNPGAAGSAWSQSLKPLDCNSDNPAIAGGAAGFGVLDGSFSGAGTVYHRYNESDGKFDLGSVTLAHESEVSPSLSQDIAGGVYATWSTGLTDLRLAYSPNGGSAWDGPVTLANSTATGDRLTDPSSAVNGAGHGWVAYSLGSTEYAQPFSAADAIVPPTVSGSAVSNGTTVKVTLTCLLATPCTFKITITGTKVTVTQASAARRHKHTITIATGHFTVRAKTSKKLRVRLTKAGKALLAKDHGHLRGSILVALKVPGGVKKTTRGISITTRTPHRR